MPYMLKGNCVHKQNADKTLGEKIKCHASRAEALAHLKALYANVPDANQQKSSPLPELWVRAHPFGNQQTKDAHGEYFDSRTKFYDDLLPVTPISYYHNRTPDGQPMGEPIAIGLTTERTYREDGRWDKVKFFDDVSQDIAERIQKAIERGTLRSSPSTVPDFHKVESDGHISHWLTGSLAIFDAEGNRQPANPRAIGIAEMKALFEQAHLEFPNLTKAGGNPNHDPHTGEFSSGGGSGGNGDGKDKGDSPKSWTDVEVKNGDKFDVMGRDGSVVMRVKVTGADPYKRFHKVEITHVNSQAKDKELAELFMGREHGGEIQLNDADLKYMRRVKKTQGFMKTEGVNMTKWQTNVRAAFDNFMKALSITLPPSGTPIPTDAPAKPDEDMTAWEEIFDETDLTDELDTDPKPETQAPDSAHQQQEDNAMDEKQIADMRAEYDNQMKAILDQNAALTQRVDRADIEKWLDTEVNGEGIKVKPAERDEIIALALNLKTTAHPTMKSADGKDTTAFDAFKKTIEARPVQIVLDKTMKGAGFDTPEAGAAPTPERKQRLLEMTGTGRAILKEKNNGHG